MPKFNVNLTIQGTIETVEENVELLDIFPLDILSRKHNEDFVKELRLRRLTKGLTLAQLSMLSGVSASHIARIERGERLPGYRIAIKLKETLEGEN